MLSWVMGGQMWCLSCQRSSGSPQAWDAAPNLAMGVGMGEASVLFLGAFGGRGNDPHQ